MSKNETHGICSKKNAAKSARSFIQPSEAFSLFRPHAFEAFVQLGVGVLRERSEYATSASALAKLEF